MKRLLPNLLLAPSAAFAHPGDHDRSSILHLMTEPDHLAFLALALAAVVVGLARLQARR